MAKLSVKALALSMGIIWGAALIIMGIVAMLAPDYASGFVTAVGSLYVGYSATVGGIIIGAVWGFVDAAIGGALIAWLYNKFAK